MTQNDQQRPALPTSRRTLVRGAAWSVPVVAVATAAPAFAASGCGQRLDWDAYAVGSQAPATALVGGVTITKAFTPVNGGATATSNNQIIGGTQGGITENSLAMSLLNPVTGRGEQITFTFAPAVYDLQFTVIDIDRVLNGWQDRVTPSSGYTVVSQGTNVVNQSGTFTATTDVNIANTSNAGNVTLKYAGPVTTISLSYVNGDTSGGGNCSVLLSDLTFCLRP